MNKGWPIGAKEEREIGAKKTGKLALNIDKTIVIPIVVSGKNLKLRFHFLGPFYEAKCFEKRTSAFRWETMFKAPFGKKEEQRNSSLLKNFAEMLGMRNLVTNHIEQD